MRSTDEKKGGTYRKLWKLTYLDLRKRKEQVKNMVCKQTILTWMIPKQTDEINIKNSACRPAKKHGFLYVRNVLACKFCKRPTIPRPNGM
jgi:hypothetical protein